MRPSTLTFYLSSELFVWMTSLDLFFGLIPLEIEPILKQEDCLLCSISFLIYLDYKTRLFIFEEIIVLTIMRLNF
jgi:hypothetical protein